MQSPLKKCITCGYSLRGIDSARCPECGAPTAWYRLTFFDPLEFARAIAVLTAADIPFQKLDAGLGQAGVQDLLAGGGAKVHELRLGINHRPAATELLRKEGIGPQVPVIDRTETHCPECNATLPPVDDPICDACHTAFHTIDVGDGDEDAGPSDGDVPPPAARKRQSPATTRALILLWITIGTVFVSPFLWSFVGSAPARRFAISAAAWLLACATYLVIAYRPRARRSPRDPEGTGEPRA